MIKIGTKFHCNKELVNSATGTIYTIVSINDNLYPGDFIVHLVWKDNDDCLCETTYDLRRVEGFFRDNIWIAHSIKDERKLKLKKLGLK